MNAFRKISGYLLVIIIFFLTVVAVLGIWEVIELENVVKNSVLSLFVIFVASVIILFIFTVVMRDYKSNKNNTIE